ncbi:hypothetical protein B0O99DRAFT_520278, partial [Bisporella sp. PMI_857]
PKRMRRRIRKACEPCRKRKVKCDGEVPCGLCVGYGYSCVYASAEVPALAQASSSSIPQPQERRPVASASQAVEIGKPEKRLYVLAQERQSPQTTKTRFTRMDSAIAFPRSLGLSLNADDPPPLQAFAWNTGTRAESVKMVQSSIFQYITLQDVESFSATYFTSVHPVFDVVNHENFDQRVTRCWATQTIDAGFEVVLCGVAALGSLFSRYTSMHEADLVEQARLILDRTFAHSGISLSVDFVVGWILRALYLRSTARPHDSWMAISIAMHISESIGLHQEMSEISTTHRTQGQRIFISDAEIEARRRVFWTADSLNRLFSAQYGRTKITLQNASCQYPTIPTNDTADDFINLIRLLPDLCDVGSLNSIAILTDGIMRLGKKAVTKLPLLLLRADMIFCIYRKLRYIGITASPALTEVILSVIGLALHSTNSIALRSEQWWTIVGVPFHSVCVLIALNTAESLDLLNKAIETLQNVANIFNTQVSQEALRTAHQLVKISEKKKRRELESLQRCLNLNASMATTITQTPLAEGPQGMMSFEWPTDIALGFSDFLNTCAVEDLGMTNG